MRQVMPDAKVSTDTTPPREVIPMARAPRQKAAEQAESLARRIWLAGLGAYGQSLEDAQQHLDRAGGEASRLFQELVEKGQHIEEQSRSGIRRSIDDARIAISGRVGSNARSVEEMIRRVRDKVGLDAALSGRLDALARRVDGLAQVLGLPSVGGAQQAEASAAPAARVATRKAPRTSPVRKTTARKAAAAAAAPRKSATARVVKKPAKAVAPRGKAAGTSAPVARTRPPAKARARRPG